MAKYNFVVTNIKDQKPALPSTPPTTSTDPQKDSQYGTGPQGAVAGGGGGGAITCACNCTCNCSGSSCSCSGMGSSTSKNVNILRKKL